VLLGDPVVSAKSMQMILRPLEERGVELLCVEWKAGMGLSEFAKLILEIETNGPMDLPTETHQVFADAEIIVTNFAPVSARTIMLAPNLRLIACTRGGTENIDVKAATERRVVVVNAPGRNSTAVADFTFGLLLAIHRRIAVAHCMMRKGIWDNRWSRPENLSTDLSGKTIGIVGYGKVGQKIAQRAKGFEMNVLVHDRYVKIKDADGVTPVALDRLLRESDFVTIHARLSSETRNLIGEKEIGMMKPTAYLINTARAGIVNEPALLRALAARQIQGAALDVFSEEPVSTDHEVTRLENVVLTPHLAGSTKEAELVNGPKMIAAEIARMLEGFELLNVVH
jgi:D-3-phosphoglycerate dehydrogenase